MGLFDKLKVDAIKSTVEAGVKSAQKNISNFNADEAIKGAAGFVATSKARVEEAVADVLSNEESPEEDSSIKELILLMWFLANADGAITESERQKLEELARSIDENYETYAAEIEHDCAERLLASAAEFGQQNAPKIEAQKIIDSLDLGKQEGKLLCWNLLALASADGLDENEVDFIRFASQKANVDAAVFAELKNYNDALLEVSAAREKLQKSSRSYAEIEPIVNEFSQREQIILEAAQALVFDM